GGEARAAAPGLCGSRQRVAPRQRRSPTPTQHRSRSSGAVMNLRGIHERASTPKTRQPKNRTSHHRLSLTLPQRDVHLKVTANVRMELESAAVRRKPAREVRAIPTFGCGGAITYSTP